MEVGDLIRSINIVEYISQYVDLTEKNGEWWGLSCFKDEKTPSFSVRENPPVFYDYSSGIGGNVFTFTRFYYRCSSKEAIEILQKYVGVEGEVVVRKKKMAATQVCRKFLPQKKREPSKQPTILPDDYMDRYEKSEYKLRVWEDEGISKESMDRFQVCYDSFSNRIVYPIRDMSGRIVNIGGRALDHDWKEKGERKYTYFFSWGTMNTVYGLFDNLDHIKEAKEVIIFEGCKSVLLANTWGIKNTGALLTSHLNPNQLKILAALGAKVVFALDKDVDPRKDHNIQKLRHYVNVEIISDTGNLLEAKDSPVDRGKETFITLYNRRARF